MSEDSRRSSTEDANRTAEEPGKTPETFSNTLTSHDPTVTTLKFRDAPRLPSKKRLKAPEPAQPPALPALPRPQPSQISMEKNAARRSFTVDDQALLEHFQLPATGLPRRHQQLVRKALVGLLERRDARGAPRPRANVPAHRRTAFTKDLFLVRFAALIVQREIDARRQSTAQREASVQAHERDIKQEVAAFLHQFVEKKAHYGRLQAELKQLKARKNEMAQELNKSRTALEALRAENRKRLETIGEMRQLQDFIEQLTPPAFSCQREKETFA